MIPEIAIIEKNTLTALGLQTILEELIPQAVIRVFHSFEARRAADSGWRSCAQHLSATGKADQSFYGYA